MTEKIVLGVSSCLLGQEVRFDGGHKRSAYVEATLSEYFDFVPFCPEMAIGLGVPRPTIRLITRKGETRLVQSDDASIDLTDQMNDRSAQQCRNMQQMSGYILKSKSPSCGMERVSLFNEKDYPEKKGVGLFAAILMQHYPNLPVEEEGRLNDAHLRENFIERVFIYYRWQQLLSQGLTVNGLMEFHRRHKFILLAHDEAAYREMGPMIASINEENLTLIADQYLAKMMLALKVHASRKKHMNVLQHIMGFLKNDIAADDKQEVLDLLDRYRLGKVPLIVPITLLRYHLRKNPQPYIDDQYYMNPYPEELMLRNHV